MMVCMYVHVYVHVLLTMRGTIHMSGSQLLTEVAYILMLLISVRQGWHEK